MLYSVCVADCNGKSNIGYITEGPHHTMKVIKAPKKPSIINLSLISFICHYAIGELCQSMVYTLVMGDIIEINQYFRYRYVSVSK